MFGIPLQPYEAHLSWQMHFFGDHCLGGNEYLKVSEYLVRHLPQLSPLQLKQKSIYPEIFNQLNETDYSYLQDYPDLKVWHSDLPEFIPDRDSSPYVRMSQSSIEIDCLS